MLDLAAQWLEQGKAQQALPLLTEHTANHPHDASGWFLLGACHHQLQQLPEALQAFERVLAIEPRHIQARLAKGVVLSALERPQEALQVLRKALHLAPNDAQLLLNLAILQEQGGDLHGALERYEQALRHHPDWTPALLNRGALLLRLQRLPDALANNRRLAELQAEWEHAHFNLGETLLALGDWHAALAAYERALALNPQAAKAQFGRGLALSMLQRFDDAQQAFEQARELNPAAFAHSLQQAAALTGGELHEFTPRTLYLLREATRLENCDWRNFAKLSAEFSALIANLPAASNELSEPALLFRTFALPLPASTGLQLATRIANRIAEKIPRHPPYPLTLKQAGRIRIGYVSPDFRTHPTAFLTRRLYGLHDRTHFEVYGYSLHPGDGSTVRHDIEKGCDVFRELDRLDDRAAADTIHRDGIDILVDLAGYTTHARPEIFAMRPVPLQVCYLGFPHTTGADYMDYFIGDETIIPASAQADFSEKIAYLPDSYFLFDNQKAIADAAQKRAAHGLPQHAFVFCCFNNNNKITPHDFDAWMEILQRTPGSVLWLLATSPAVADNLRREAIARSVSGERLVFAGFMPNEQHLARYRLADLFLDTRYCNAHTTAAEALWAGLPVLTCPGATMAARVAGSLLKAIDLPELIAGSPQEYIERACRLAVQHEELAALRSRLNEGKLNAPLFATERQIAHLEALYRAM
ncbi:MAG TPA: tetratricopeptide repeat protein, partial [Gallionella sp.]|nr:tetratricopeptide repeat protein [Gallionella sp.]